MGKRSEKRTVVIIAEDDPDDRLLIKDALEEASQQPVDIFFVQDGAEMLDYLYHRGRFTEAGAAPSPVLVLEEIKSDPALRAIPVVVLTTSHEHEHITRSYELGGNGFVTKPNSYQKLVEMMQNIEKYWFKTVELP
jgi:CheY-like chemotaxis protein